MEWLQGFAAGVIVASVLFASWFWWMFVKKERASR